MKANPDNRWRKMPPGSAESLPPSNAKPYTPSLSNGVTCGKLLTSSLDSEQTMSENDQISQSSVPAPKPFKKRYLASNQAASGAGSGGSSSVSPGHDHTPPSASPVSSVAVSPEAATACEALMELSRTDGRGSRSSEGSGSERRGSPSDTQPPKTLREAVWSNVATTLLKQEEEKLVEPPKDSPMNLSAQCTIRGQQIIEHIIENILDKPVEGLGPPCEPINVSVNNNLEEGIKASIYESLKNDLLFKGKSTSNGGKSVSAPATPPGAAVPVSGCPAAAVKVTCTPVTKPSPVALVLNQGSKLPMHNMTVTTVSTSSSSSSPPSLSSSHSPNSVTPPGPGHQDVLKLLARNSQLPISVGNSAITITKTPRVTQSQPATSVAAMSPTPVSVSLTRTGSNQVFNLSSIGGGTMSGVPVVLTSQPGVMLTTHPPQGSVVLTGMAGHQPSECVLLSPASSQGLILQQAGVGGALQQGQVMLAPAAGQPLLIAAGSKLILAPSAVHQPVTQRLVTTQANTNNSVTISQSIPVNDNSDPVNLSVRSTLRSPDNSISSVSVTPQVATLKRPASDVSGDDDDIRRSSRHSKGKKYQEFLEDGRINLSTNKNKRRSHKSGDADDSIDGEMNTEPLDQNDCKPSITDHSAPQISNNQINHHWKKKLRTVSLGENTQSHVTSGGSAQQMSPVTLTATMSNTANNQHQDTDRQYHKKDFDNRNNHRSTLVSRSTRQTMSHSAPTDKLSSSAGGRTFDVKLGNKKMRGEKISH